MLCGAAEVQSRNPKLLRTLTTGPDVNGFEKSLRIQNRKGKNGLRQVCQGPPGRRCPRVLPVKEVSMSGRQLKKVSTESSTETLKKPYSDDGRRRLSRAAKGELCVVLKARIAGGTPGE